MPHATVVDPSRGRLRPLGLDEVTVTGGFWGRRQHVNATATLDHVEHWLEREGWLGNFDLAASGALPAGRRGREFSDSEVYKFLEATAWEIGRAGDGRREARFRSVVDRVAAAQEPDGYLGTMFGRPGQGKRWSDLEWGHELYCIGHLLQAAVARARTRPDADDGLLAVARRAADLVCDVFGEDGIASVCGHAEVEPALVELARVTGEPRYLRQAELFVNRRGHGTLADVEFGRAYFQDDVPVRDAAALRGHAVRAGYLAAGATDLAVERADEDLLAALTAQWDATAARRTYLTGGLGAHHRDEAIGEDWVLPPDRAYSETCAGIASIMFSWRLLLARGLPRHADQVERVLYNVVATSPAADGRSFFYANTLHQRSPGRTVPTDAPAARASSSGRAPWFAVSCCPPNVARTLAALAGYVATADDEGVQLHQYTPASVRTALPDGRAVHLDVQTDLPHDGVVRVHVRGDAGAPWTLTLRVPAWAAGATVVVPAAAGVGPGAVVVPAAVGADAVSAAVGAGPGAVAVEGSAAGPGSAVAGGTGERPAPVGTVAVRRHFRDGDVVELRLPVAPRFTAPDPRIDAVRGCLAVERGPEVLCLESVDLAEATGGRLHDVASVRLDASVPPREEGGRVVVRLHEITPPDAPWPYGSPGEAADAGAPGGDGAAEGAGFDVPLVAYHDWAERGPSTMRVWLPTG